MRSSSGLIFLLMIETTGKTSSETISSERIGELWSTCKVIAIRGANSFIREDSQYTNRDERSKVKYRLEPSSHSMDIFESLPKAMQYVDDGTIIESACD